MASGNDFQAYFLVSLTSGQVAICKASKVLLGLKKFFFFETNKNCLFLSFNPSSCEILCSLILKGFPWCGTLEQLTDYCCSENVVFGMVIATLPTKTHSCLSLLVWTLLRVFGLYMTRLLSKPI